MSAPEDTTATTTLPEVIGSRCGVCSKPAVWSVSRCNSEITLPLRCNDHLVDVLHFTMLGGAILLIRISHG